MQVTVRGKVTTGSGEGKKFTQLAWVKQKVKEKLGFEPYPGTLNLSLPPDAEAIRLLDAFRGWKIESKNGCLPGRFYKALIMDRIHGAVVRPEVPCYPRSTLEIVAPVNLREELHLEDGDELKVRIWLEEEES